MATLVPITRAGSNTPVALHDVVEAKMAQGRVPDKLVPCAVPSRRNLEDDVALTVDVRVGDGHA
jgi:hypothetical protein